MNDRFKSCLAQLFALLLLTTALISTAEAQNAGRVAAVNQEATGTPPGAEKRTLSIGTNIVRKEKVQTSANGSTQIVFPDSSTLNVGRNSTIVIDEFVYDPSAGSGKMAATIGKGVLRFVGGQISHNDGVTIKSAVATLGIRGGTALVVYPIPAGFGAGDPNLAGAKGELIIGGIGTSTITNNTGSVTLPPGYATYVTGPNDPIPTPFRISDAVLAYVTSRLSSQPGQNGGTPGIPSQTAGGINFGTTIVTSPTSPPGTDPLGYTSITDGGSGAAKNKSQGTQTGQTNSPPSPPTEPLNTGPPGNGDL